VQRLIIEPWLKSPPAPAVLGVSPSAASTLIEEGIQVLGRRGQPRSGGASDDPSSQGIGNHW
jgi:hypothetical protein